MDREAQREAEARELIHRVLESNAPEGMEETELLAVVDWLIQARTDRALLKLFEEGRIRIRWKDGEPIFFPRERS